MFVARSETGILVPAITAWCDEAQRIVVYPEDFGMNRNQVRGLERMLAARNALVRGKVVEPTQATPHRTCEPRLVRLQRRRLIAGGAVQSVEGLTRPAA